MSNVAGRAFFGVSAIGAVGLGLALAALPGAPILTAAALLVGLTLVSRVLRVEVPSASPYEWTLSRATARRVLGFLLVCLFGYDAAFNYMSNGTRLALAGLVSAALSLLSILVLASCANRLGRQAAGLCVCLIGVALTSALALAHSVNAVATFRMAFPLLLASALVFEPELMPRRLIGILCVVLSLGGLLISLSSGTHLINDVHRLSPFTGGLDGVHSSAYTLALCAIVLNELRRQDAIRAAVAWPVMAADLAGVYELKVATALVMFLVYAGLRGLRGGSLGRKILVAVAVVGIATLAYQTRAHDLVTAPYGAQTVNADTLSSGRVTAWRSRLQIADGRSAGLLFFGGGVGSDELSISGVWNGTTKNSHNDFLTIFFELGLIGLALYAAIVALLARVAGRASWPLIAALLAASALSNAMYGRPMIAPLLWIGVALAAREQRVRDVSVAAESFEGRTSTRPAGGDIGQPR